MKYILVFLIMSYSIFAANITELKWKDGETFSEYLDKHHIVFDELKYKHKDDVKYLSEINSYYPYYELLDEKGRLEQALIPISNEMEIHLKRNRYTKVYEVDITPIVYEKKEYFGKVIIDDNPYNDIVKNTHNEKLAKRLSLALGDVIASKKWKKGDEIDFVYTEKMRMGKPCALPDIEIIRVKTGKNEKFIYIDKDGHGTENANTRIAYKVKQKRTKRKSGKVKSTFGMPLRHVRITSSFSLRRWHPILHRYRPHHGTDFGARRGVPLLAVNDGVVSFSGRMRGYGNVVKIKHPGGYESLYAHQSRRRVKRGQKVKKGQIIGYVGSTGRSTGPHLHFGLMKNGRWINPMKVLGKKTIQTRASHQTKDMSIIKYKTTHIKNTKEKRLKLLDYIQNNTPTHILEDYQ